MEKQAKSKLFIIKIVFVMMLCVVAPVTIKATSFVTVEVNFYDEESKKEYYRGPVTSEYENATNELMFRYGASNDYYRLKENVRPCLYVGVGGYVQPYVSKDMQYVFWHPYYSLTQGLKQELMYGGSFEKKWLKDLIIPIFTSSEAAKYYVETGKVKDKNDIDTLPPGFIVDEDGNVGEIPEDEKNLGYPLEFKYFLPGMVGNSNKEGWEGWQEAASKMPLIGNNLHEFQAQWENKNDKSGYFVQIQYKGTYKMKKNFLSKWVEVSTPYVDIGEVLAKEKKYIKDEMYVDMGVQSPVFLKIKEQLDWDAHPDSNWMTGASMEQQSGSMRIRYLKKNKKGEIISYGTWIKSTINADGFTSSAVDDDDNIITTPEYGNGKDYTIGDNNANPDSSKLNAIDTIKSLGENFGQLPAFLASQLAFIPKEVWSIFLIGITLLVTVALIKALL